MAVVCCSQCGVEVPLQADLRYFLDGMRMCSDKCMHAAGCRSNCGPWCACTGYAIKRRKLRDHRVQMRLMDELIVQNGLDAELNQLAIEETGDICFDLNWDSEMDEPSDAEDPEQQLRAALADQSAMVQAVQGALECRSVLLDMERARMELEDLRSRQLR